MTKRKAVCERTKFKHFNYLCSIPTTTIGLSIMIFYLHIQVSMYLPRYLIFVVT